MTSAGQSKPVLFFPLPLSYTLIKPILNKCFLASLCYKAISPPLLRTENKLSELLRAFALDFSLAGGLKSA